MIIKLYRCELFTIEVNQLPKGTFQVVEIVEDEIRIDARYMTLEQAMFKAADLLFQWNQGFVDTSEI